LQAQLFPGHWVQLLSVLKKRILDIPAFPLHDCGMLRGGETTRADSAAVPTGLAPTLDEGKTDFQIFLPPSH
jgi:hypothetical protein